MWLEEVEDDRVTRLVEMMRSGKTFKPEDCPGGDRSISPKTEEKKTEEKKTGGRLLKDEKTGGGTVHRRNLRPRKPVVVNCKDESSSGDGGPEGPPQTGGCSHEGLKPWIAEQLKKLSTEFKHHLGEMEKNICRRLGGPEATINKSQKRKANEDNHGQSESQISGGKQTRSHIRWAKKTKLTATSPGGKKHSYPLRSGDGNDASEVATKGDTPALFEREKFIENEYHKTRSPPFDENIADEGMRTPNAAEDCLQPEKSGTAVTALTVYSNVLLVQPQSYVSPPKSTPTRWYQDEEAVPVAWEERNPNLYNSVKTVHTSHPASSTYPESEANVASTGNKDVGEAVLVEENLGVLSPVVEGGAREPPLVEERKPCSPKKEEDEKYDSCKEDISNDSQLQEKETQPKRGHPLSDTDDGLNDVESGGKRQRKKNPTRFVECTPQTQG
ncbi:hypothetical protein DY000_02022720 [Brassica cretica]|uniref:Uncharacterized protein n=1 Tax=Brassica cretica TaxID=69181 RepID=A0ABQ7EHE0_BRACR|nr:hypothetical protein DY000_02022720 [Brassica cretica]